ncbi:transposase, partial [Streptomyces sp. F001]|uniref:transposase n=1 Tax=Streptomyces sp. F001 TaxID=1510026 RepID=UPI001F1043DC
MTDTEWAQVRPLLPVPGWMRGRGGRPEAYCHRAMLDAIRYLVDNGIKWRAMPADFPPWDRVYAFCAPCGASLYPRLNREKLGGMFLGRLTYLEAKAEGDNSMSGKRWPSGGIQGGARVIA